MAKVTGPLFSIGARGKLGQAIVYSFWKGVNVVREYLIPANPQTGKQGDRRLILGGLGRAPKYVQAESPFKGYAKAVAPSGQSWISYFVKYIMVTYCASVSNFEDLYDAFDTHGAAADWITEAEGLGLVTFDVTYKDTVKTFHSGLQLYCLALYGVDQQNLDNTKFNVSPYTAAIDTWDLAKIQEMVADFTPA